MRISRIIVAPICYALCGAAAFAASGGALSGSVVDGNGSPIPGALVLYKSVPIVATAANGERVITGPGIGAAVKTAADGTFAVTGLPSAGYLLCAYGTKSNHLGSCEWGQGTARVDVADGQTAHLTFVVAEGALITFQVEDPKQQVIDLESLPVANGRLPLTGANFSIGISAGTRYERARLLSVTGATRRYQLAIPKTATIRLYLDTTLNVADAQGAAIALRQQSTAVAAGGQDEVVVHLAIP